MSWRPNRLQRRLGIKPDPFRLNQSSQPPPPLATEAESEFDVTISFLNGASIEDDSAPIEPIVEEPVPEPVTEEPAPEPEPEPVVEEPAPAPVPEPVVEEPAPAPEPEPVAEEPAPAPEPEPVVEEPVPEPVAEEPAPEPEPEPVVEEPAPAPEPVVEEPAPAPEPEPVVEEPAPAPEPVVEEPAPAPEPVVEEPAPAPEPEPVAEEPAPAPEPEPVVEEPVPEPVVEEPAPAPEPVAEEPAPAPEPEPVAEEPAPAAEPEPQPVAEEPAPAPEPVAEEPAPAPEPEPVAEEPAPAPEPVVEEPAPALEPVADEFEEPATMETTETVDPAEAERIQRERTAIVTIGINYFGQSGELKGCINDSRNFLAYAQSIVGTRASSTIQLLDTMASSDPFYPSRVNIERVLGRVVQEAWEGKCGHIILHYSGHGGSIADTGTDEADQKDETLVPVDFNANGLITDDWLFENVINAIPPEVKFFALIDACHSGTMFDLRYKVTGDPPVNTLVNPGSSESSSAMLISGCKDEQFSYDVWDAQHGAVGAMTTAWLTEMNADRKRSAYEIVKSMRASLTAKGYPQTPQLSTTKPLAHPYPIYALGEFD